MIFLDPTKAYDALERSQSLNILKGYGSETAAEGVMEQFNDGGKGGRVLRDRI